MGASRTGNACLLARRLIEAGVPLVTVNWHDDHLNFWDTHGDNFNHLKDRLMPPADRGLSTLLDDLESRALLEETLVVWVGEFGREAAHHLGNAGREHWPHCAGAAVLAAGIRARSTAPPTDGPPTRPATPSDPMTSEPRSCTPWASTRRPRSAIPSDDRCGSIAATRSRCCSGRTGSSAASSRIGLSRTADVGSG